MLSRTPPQHRAEERDDRFISSVVLGVAIISESSKSQSDRYQFDRSPRILHTGQPSAEKRRPGYLLVSQGNIRQRRRDVSRIIRAFDGDIVNAASSCAGVLCPQVYGQITCDLPIRTRFGTARITGRLVAGDSNDPAPRQVAIIDSCDAQGYLLHSVVWRPKHLGTGGGALDHRRLTILDRDLKAATIADVPRCVHCCT